MNINNAFWKDVLESWLCYIKVYEKQDRFRNNYYSIPVWYNSNIKIGNKVVFFKSWYDKGVKVVQDFLDEDGHFLCYDVFQQLYNLDDFCIMKYNSVTSAISKYLKLLSIDKTSIRRLPSPCLPIYFEPILIVEKCTKIIYNYLNVKEVNPTSINKWKQELNVYGEVTVAVKDIFKVCFKTTCDSTVQWLQFRILYRLLPVGNYLKKKSILNPQIAVDFVTKM